METKLTINEIMEYLPHRYPFLLIDRIIDLKRGESITALKNVSINEPYFQGHFPGQPVMPGVLIIEAMAQAGGVLLLESLQEIEKGTLMYFMSMDKVKFRKPVVPGDQLILKCKFLRRRANVAKMSCTAYVDETAVSEAELMANYGDQK